MTTGPPTNSIHSQLKSTSSTDVRLSPTMSWKPKFLQYWIKVCCLGIALGRGTWGIKCTWFIPKVFVIEDSIGKCRSGLSVVGLCNGKEPWGDRQVTSAVLKGGPSQLRLLLLPTPLYLFQERASSKNENWLNLASELPIVSLSWLFSVPIKGKCNGRTPPNIDLSAIICLPWLFARYN